MYGEHRPFGYAYGGSGGGFRTIGGAENTVGVWDGVVPYVIGSPMAIPNMFTVRMHAQRILRGQFDRIVDAVEPGGSGDPYDGLSDEERDALRRGHPHGASRCARGSATGPWACTPFRSSTGAWRQADPSYFEEFWTEPGYLDGGSLHRHSVRDRVRFRRATSLPPSAMRRPPVSAFPVGPDPGGPAVRWIRPGVGRRRPRTGTRLRSG